VGTALINADIQRDRQKDRTKLIGAFRYYANAYKICSCTREVGIKEEYKLSQYEDVITVYFTRRT